MSKTHSNPADLPGGPGDLAATTIDLRKPGDVMLVLRAVQNDWPVPQHIRDQIIAQVGGALDASSNATPRSTRRQLRLIKLLIAMDATDRIADGVPKSHFPYLRRRRPEKRSPRWMRS